MTENPEPTISVRVDPANPGQFFACCGLLELADRLWRGAEGWFEDGNFLMHPIERGSHEDHSLGALVRTIAAAPLRQIDEQDEYASPLQVGAPFGLRLDWWKDDRAGGARLKVWAGSMRSVRIAHAMQSVLHYEELQNSALLDYASVVYDPADPDNKVEPFYFDARRGSGSRSIDIGFAPDSLQMTNLAWPAVEFLSLIGLQRFRPAPTAASRVFDYYIWKVPLPINIARIAACGMLINATSFGFQFETAFRTDQRKHKAFTTATQFMSNQEERE